MNSSVVDFVSPKFLKASTALSLQEKMKALILMNGKQYDFYSIQQLSDGKFIAWYREEIKFKLTETLKARRK